MGTDATLYLDREDMLALYPAPMAEVREDRFVRLAALMEEQGCQALVVAGRGIFGQRGNLRFVSNYSPIVRFACALLNPATPPKLLVPYPVHQYWAGSTSWIEDIHFSTDFVEDSVSYLESAGCRDATIGVAGADFVSSSYLQEIRAHLPAVTFKLLDEPLARMRMKKTPLDLQFLQLSAGLADAGFDRLVEVMRPGVLESELFAELEYVLRKGGAEANMVLLTSTGRHTTPWPAQRKLQAGDVLIVSIEPLAPGGYLVQFQRTFSLGNPSDEVRSTFEFCLRVEEATRQGLIPGNTAAQAAKRGLEVFDEAGGSTQSMIIGHGIGIDLGELPRISMQDETTLETDMVIALHPSIYKDDFGVCVGDTYHLTQQGPVSLSRWPTDLIVL